MPPLVDCGFPDKDLLTAVGPTMRVQIGLDEDYDPGGPDINLPTDLHDALIDAGARLLHLVHQLPAAARLPLSDAAASTAIEAR